MFYVRQSSVRGCRFYFVFVYFIIKVFKCSPVPSSFFPIYELCYIGAETREEGGTRCQRSLAAEGNRGAEEIEQQKEAETASSCPRRWCWSNRRTGGTEGSLPCSWVEEGWLPSEREWRSRRRSLGGRNLLTSAMSGEEQGTGDCPERGTHGAMRWYWTSLEEHRAVHQRCPVPSHGTVSESLSAS